MGFINDLLWQPFKFAHTDRTVRSHITFPLYFTIASIAASGQAKDLYTAPEPVPANQTTATVPTVPEEKNLMDYLQDADFVSGLGTAALGLAFAPPVAYRVRNRFGRSDTDAYMRPKHK